jgi:hypothetical protein
MIERRAVSTMVAVALAAACFTNPRSDDAALGTPSESVVVEPCQVDVSVAMADSVLLGCLRAHERFAELLAAPGLPITIHEDSGIASSLDIRDGRIHMTLGNRQRLGELTSSWTKESSVGIDATEFVAHELGHAQLFFHVDPDGPPATDGYGTTLPDWFDEAAAIWNEPDESLLSRLERARELPDSAFDVVALTTRRHPMTMPGGTPGVRRDFLIIGGTRCRVPDCAPADELAPRILVRSVDAAGVVRVDTLRPGDPGFDYYDQPDFYAPVAALVVYLHHRGGATLLREIVRRMRAGKSADDVFTGLPGLPRDPADVARDWRAFIRATGTR